MSEARCCAIEFARQGAQVVVAPIRGRIRDAGGAAVFVQGDVGRSEDVQRMVRTAVDTYGGLDCAINNAVCNIGTRPLAEISESDWERALGVNLTGVFLCMKYEIAAMLERGAGAIVNIGSGNEHTALPGHGWYLAAKQGVYGLTKVAALDYGRRGIRVNAVAPGPMWTPMLRQAVEGEPAHLEKLTARVPVGRIAEPEEVANIAVWLCTSAASYVMGHTLSVDGGFVLG